MTPCGRKELVVNDDCFPKRRQLEASNEEGCCLTGDVTQGGAPGREQCALPASPERDPKGSGWRGAQGGGGAPSPAFPRL